MDVFFFWKLYKNSRFPACTHPRTTPAFLSFFNCIAATEEPLHRDNSVCRFAVSKIRLFQSPCSRSCSCACACACCSRECRDARFTFCEKIVRLKNIQQIQSATSIYIAPVSQISHCLYMRFIIMCYSSSQSPLVAQAIVHPLSNWLMSPSQKVVRAS